MCAGIALGKIENVGDRIVKAYGRIVTPTISQSEYLMDVAKRYYGCAYHSQWSSETDVAALGDMMNAISLAESKISEGCWHPRR